MDGIGGSVFGPRRMKTAVLVAVACAWLGPATLGAQAATVTTDCANLQNNLDTAASGDTIVLEPDPGPNPLCTGDFSLSNASHDSRSLTLEGQPGAGFDGSTATTSVLHTLP